MPLALSIAVGALAILATTAAVVTQALLAQAVTDQDTSLQITAIVAAALEGLVTIMLCWCIATYTGLCARGGRIKRFNSIGFGLSLLFCTMAAAVSAAAIVCLSAGVSSLPSSILGSRETGFLISSSLTLGVAFATQLAFLVVHYISSRIHRMDERYSLHTEEGASQSAQPHIKSIPYHHTVASEMKDRRDNPPMDTRTPPGSSDGRSAADTRSSIGSSFSRTRSVSSRTHLLAGSQRTSRRPPSLDFSIFREQRLSKEDSFDSWDTSMVDPQNRQTVLETSPPASRVLEPIPASPTTSRSPSPGTPFGLEPLQPPKIARRSRSFSPSTPSRQSLRPTFTQHTTVSESHIHPLFRSDSPTPPPIATPGTVVVAAPNGGQLIISDRGSIRTLNRMRSATSFATSSPLAQQTSFESFQATRKFDRSSSGLREEPEESVTDTERKLTPPIPEWVMAAGSRTSLTDYNNRKSRIADDETTRSDQEQS